MFILILDFLIKILSFGNIDLLESYDPNTNHYILSRLEIEHLLILIASILLWFIAFKTVKGVLRK